jgi:hypothetical protein
MSQALNEAFTWIADSAMLGLKFLVQATRTRRLVRVKTKDIRNKQLSA